MKYWIREPKIGVIEAYDSIISARKRAMQLLLRKDMRERRWIWIYTSEHGKKDCGRVFIRLDEYMWQSPNDGIHILSVTGKIKKSL